MDTRARQAPLSFKLLPAYLDTESVAEALRTSRGRRILCLEILVNDQPDWSLWQDQAGFDAVYRNAC